MDSVGNLFYNFCDKLQDGIDMIFLIPKLKLINFKIKRLSTLIRYFCIIVI